MTIELQDQFVGITTRPSRSRRMPIILLSVVLIQQKRHRAVDDGGNLTDLLIP